MRSWCSIKPDGDSKIDVTRNISDPIGFPLSAGQIGIWFARRLIHQAPRTILANTLKFTGPSTRVCLSRHYAKSS